MESYQSHTFMVGGFKYEVSVKVTGGCDEPTEREKQNIAMTLDFVKVMVDQASLFCRKNRDYSPANIARAGELGVLIRCGDKFARLDSIRESAAMARASGYKPSVSDETIEDTWADVANYGVIARMIRSGKWPGVRPGWSIDGSNGDKEGSA